MSQEQHTKQRKPEMRNLQMQGAPQGLADEDAPDPLDFDGARRARAVSRMVPTGQDRATEGRDPQARA